MKTKFGNPICRRISCFKHSKFWKHWNPKLQLRSLKLTSIPFFFFPPIYLRRFYVPIVIVAFIFLEDDSTQIIYCDQSCTMWSLNNSCKYWCKNGFGFLFPHCIWTSCETRSQKLLNKCFLSLQKEVMSRFESYEMSIQLTAYNESTACHPNKAGNKHNRG